MFLILPQFEAKTCFLIITDNVQDEKIILNVFFNICILYYLKFERNNVSVLISDPPLSPMLQFCRLLCGLFCVGLLLALVCFFVSLNFVESPFYAILSQYYSGQMPSNGFSFFEKS